MFQSNETASMLTTDNHQNPTSTRDSVRNPMIYDHYQLQIDLSLYAFIHFWYSFNQISALKRYSL